MGSQRSSHHAAHNPPQGCITSPSINHTASRKGRGEHRAHKYRLAKGVILHYLLRGTELSGTPLTVCCAPHTVPIHSGLPLFVLAGGEPGTSVGQINRPGNSLCYLQCQWLWGKKHTAAFLSMRIQKGD